MTTPNNVPPAGIDYYAEATYRATADYLRARLPEPLRQVTVMVVCGSGLGGLADTLEEPRAEFHYADIPNFAVST
ncbi:hypothetical protein HK405_013873, partial [Cladochytrium tenue]